MSKLYRSFQPTLTEPGLQHFGLSLEYSAPNEVLKGVVHSYLQITAIGATPYPVIPDGTQAIFISPNGSLIGGAQLEACEVQIPGPGEYFGIRFYPGALRHFVELDLSEITGRFVDPEYFPHEIFRDLHCSLYRCSTFSERANMCERWLLKHFQYRSPTQFDQALSLIYQTSGNIKISELAAGVGWSARHLNRLFRRYTGLTTKQFSLIMRIQGACRQLYVTPGNSLKTSIELGFFDQAHLIKEFNRWLLSSPNAYFDRFVSDFYNS